MLIKSVELKNIKSYKQETIEFKEGINGITGMNGHGKTTILEAIGYVLFDYLPYKEADFLRGGEKMGYVSVDVLVNGASYILTRKLGANEYSVRGANISITGKKDVLAWIVSNLFTTSTHDELPRIFENAVGVPQGMLIASFMETPVRRRKTFDEILRVEEYRSAYESLRNTMSLIDESVGSIENEISMLRVRTESYEKKKIEGNELSRKIEDIKKALKECSESLSVVKKSRDDLKKQKDALSRLENETKQSSVKLDGIRQLLEKTADELNKAKEAQKIIAELERDKERYEMEKKNLEKLEGMRKERDLLKDKLSKIENEVARLNEKRSRYESLKAEIEKRVKEKAHLNPMVEKQAELEIKIEEIKGKHAVVLNEIKEIKDRISKAGNENLCPVMKGIRCVSVENFSSYFRQQLAEAQAKLEDAGSAVKDLGTKLKSLGEPRSKVNALDLLIGSMLDEIGRLGKEIEKIHEKEKVNEEFKKELEKYNSLDLDISEANKKLMELEPAYRKYLLNHSLASRFMEFRKECEGLEKAIEEEEVRQIELKKQYEEAKAGFGAEMLERAERTYVELETKIRAFEVEAREKSRQLQKLNKEIAEMETYLSKITELGAELENEKRFRDYAKFIRETIRDSAQHIVLELISEISEEANKLYCAIMDDFSQELRWNEDYGIIITEGGEEKNFLQLSGGEKMGAALALRLALLKMLSNSDFVFLDEPTQNMDEIRRENLSEQIMNIKGFKQIFVISHDDTFNEKYGHVVKIQKINNESRVVYA